MRDDLVQLTYRLDKIDYNTLIFTNKLTKKDILILKNYGEYLNKCKDSS